MTTLNCSDGGYGDGEYGLGGYGGTIDFDNGRALHDAYLLTPIHIEPSTEFEKLNCSLKSQLDRISSEVQDIAQAHDIDNAEGQHLDFFGNLVGITRNENESDDHFRQRIKINGRVTVSSATTDEIMELSILALESDFDTIDFPIDLATNPAQFDVEAPSSVVSDAVLTESEIETEVGKALPAGHRLELTTV